MGGKPRKQCRVRGSVKQFRSYKRAKPNNHVIDRSDKRRKAKADRGHDEIRAYES